MLDAGLVSLIARVRRAMPRIVRGAGAQRFRKRYSGSSATLQANETWQGNVSKECPVCAARREADRARLARHRAKRRG
jgi:hypothetical protein